MPRVVSRYPAVRSVRSASWDEQFTPIPTSGPTRPSRCSRPALSVSRDRNEQDALSPLPFPFPSSIRNHPCGRSDHTIPLDRISNKTLWNNSRTSSNDARSPVPAIAKASFRSFSDWVPRSSLHTSICRAVFSRLRRQSASAAGISLCSSAYAS